MWTVLKQSRHIQRVVQALLNISEVNQIHAQLHLETEIRIVSP